LILTLNWLLNIPYFLHTAPIQSLAITTMMEKIYRQFIQDDLKRFDKGKRAGYW
jgi:hypothetical protein